MKKLIPFALFLLFTIALVVFADGTATGLPGLPGRASGGGGVTSVTATAPVVSSGGTTPDISVTNAVLQQTIATATYYVDPTGNNSNACTSSGASACATLTGVFAKFPNFRINDAVTINVAEGTYTETPSILGLDIAAAVTITGPGLTDAGVTTGTASGTITAINNVAPATVTDGTQTWTTNDLIGKFLVITSGAQNGQVRLIATNDATTLTLAAPFSTAPSVADSYAIRVPGAKITNNSSTTTLILRLAGSTVSTSATAPTFSVTGMDFLNTSTGAACSLASAEQTMSFTNSRCIASGSAGVAFRGGGVLTMTSAVAMGTSGGLTYLPSPISFTPATLTPSSALFYGSTGAGLSAQAAPMYLQGAGSWTAQTGSTVSGAIFIATASYRTVTGAGVPVIRCLTAGGIGLYSPSSAVTNLSPGSQSFDNLYIDGCATGIYYGSRQSTLSVLSSGKLVCNGATTCVSVYNGASVRIPTANFTPDAGSPNVNAISIDGTVYSKTDYTTASPVRITNTATGSTVWE